MATHLEVERKFDAAPGTVVPALVGVDGVAAESAGEEVRLEAVYFDTVDLALSARGITLRRRTGGGDDGWHLKLPRGDRGLAARLEVQQPLGQVDETVPDALLDRVLVITRRAPVVPVATIGTTRTRRLLRDGDDVPLAEVADDRVEATAHAGAHDGRVVRWREVEVELVEGDDGVLDRVGSALVDAGLTASTAASKLHHVLGTEPEPPAASTAARRGSDAGTVLLAYLHAQVRRVASQDPLVRDAGSEAHGEGVHHLRVATRRMRSVLATYRPFLDRARTDPLRDELAWLGGLLGDVRDLQVLRAHLLDAIDALPGELVVGRVRDRVDHSLRDRERAARKRLLEGMRTERYFSLLDALDALVLDPPLTPRSGRPARSRLPARVTRERRRVGRRHHDLQQSGDHDRDSALHELRKAAKRGRYAAEVLEPLHDRDGRRLVKALTAVQQSLGEHHDTVVARAMLAGFATVARHAGEDTFTYGVLHGREELRADAAVREFRKAWKST